MTRPTTRSVTKEMQQQQKIQNKQTKVIVVRNTRLRPQRSVSIGTQQPPTPDCLNHINRMPPEMMWKVFDALDLIDKIKSRAVCQLWKAVVEELLASRTRYVRLNLKKLGKNSDCSKWNPEPSYRAMQFESFWEEPVDLCPIQKVSLTLPAVSLKIAKTFSRIFCQVHTLVIYFDLKDTQSNIKHLISLLSRSFTNVRSFSLIMSTKITNEQTLALICRTIDAKLGLLKRLNLFVSDYDRVTPFGLHPNAQLTKTLPHLEHMGLSCAPLNLVSIIFNIGKNHKAHRELNLTNRELANLSIQCRIDESGIERLFATNPELVRVNRLQLTCLSGGESHYLPKVDKFLSQFINVQNLQLFYFQPLFATFNKLLFPILAKLPKLTELTLGEFVLGNDIPQRADYRLPNIKKFTLSTCDLLTRYKRNSLDRVFNTEQFTQTIAYMFPSLEEIVIQAGEGETFQKPLDMLKEEMRNLLFSKLKSKFKSVHIDFQDSTCLQIRKGSVVLAINI